MSTFIHPARWARKKTAFAGIFPAFAGITRAFAGIFPAFAGIFLVLVALAPPAEAQTRPFVAARAYPAGVVSAAGFSRGWSGQANGRNTGDSVPLESRTQFEAGVWIGANLTRRRDWGEHDDERGGGFGGGVELTWFPGGNDAGLFAGARASIWRMEIEWRDDQEAPPGPSRTGETNILVLQPTLRGGFRFGLGGRLRLDAEAALGAEINTLTDGEEVGQGAIALAGLRLVF